MVEEMSDATRLLTGKFLLQKSKVDLNELIHDVVESLSVTLLKSNCVLSLKDPQKVTGHWDHSRLQQVLTNLIINAKKYAASSRIEVTLTATSDSATISVTDYGPGISVVDQATSDIKQIDEHASAADLERGGQYNRQEVRCWNPQKRSLASEGSGIKDVLKAAYEIFK